MGLGLGLALGLGLGMGLGLEGSSSTVTDGKDSMVTPSVDESAAAPPGVLRRACAAAMTSAESCA